MIVRHRNQKLAKEEHDKPIDAWLPSSNPDVQNKGAQHDMH
jgi:hypothetical protein